MRAIDLRKLSRGLSTLPDRNSCAASPTSVANLGTQLRGMMPILSVESLAVAAKICVHPALRLRVSRPSPMFKVIGDKTAKDVLRLVNCVVRLCLLFDFVDKLLRSYVSKATGL